MPQEVSNVFMHIDSYNDNEDSSLIEIKANFRKFIRSSKKRRYLLSYQFHEIAVVHIHFQYQIFFCCFPKLSNTIFERLPQREMEKAMKAQIKYFFTSVAHLLIGGNPFLPSFLELDFGVRDIAFFWSTFSIGYRNPEGCGSRFFHI